MSRRDERVALLLRKAAQDEFVVAQLRDNPAAADEVVGFHAQQAVEKLLKAALAWRAVPYPRTHDLTALILLLKQSGGFPADLEDVRALTPLAVEYRYGELPSDPDERVDRAWLQSCVQRVRVWVRQEVAGQE